MTSHGETDEDAELRKEVERLELRKHAAQLRADIEELERGTAGSTDHEQVPGETGVHAPTAGRVPSRPTKVRWAALGLVTAALGASLVIAGRSCTSGRSEPGPTASTTPGSAATTGGPREHPGSLSATTPPTASAILEAARSTATSARTPWLSQSLSEVALSYAVAGQRAASEHTFAEAARAVRQKSGEFMASDAENLGYVAAMMARARMGAEALKVARTPFELAKEPVDKNYYLGEALCRAAWAALESGDRTTAGRAWGEALSAARRIPADNVFFTGYRSGIVLDAARGYAVLRQSVLANRLWEEATDLRATAYAQFPTPPDARDEVTDATDRARFLASGGDFRAAEAVFGKAIATSSRIRGAYNKSLALGWIAEYYGQSMGVRARPRTLVLLTSRVKQLPRSERSWPLATVAGAYIACDRLDRASPLAAQSGESEVIADMVGAYAESGQFLTAALTARALKNSGEPDRYAISLARLGRAYAARKRQPAGAEASVIAELLAETSVSQQPR